MQVVDWPVFQGVLPCPSRAAALLVNVADVMFGAVRLVFCNLCYDRRTCGIIHRGGTGFCLALRARLPLSMAGSEVVEQLLCHGSWLSRNRVVERPDEVTGACA